MITTEVVEGREREREIPLQNALMALYSKEYLGLGASTTHARRQG
jgi:hypothetical protein